MYTLIETCCGSAALTLHLLGARRPLLPYQGSKWRFRHGLAGRLAELGFAGPPAEARLYDPSPWGRTMAVVRSSAPRTALIARLRAFAAEDAQTAYLRTHGAPAATDDATFAAEFLFLQRLAFSGKAVGLRDGRWTSPGFNTSSAYGLPGTDRFGAVKPMIPSLVRVLEGYDRLAEVPGESRSAAAPLPAGPVDRPTVVYVDPPYAGSTRYPNGDLARAEVEALASAWRDAGATVLVSESEPLPGLVRAGWSAERLYAGRDDTSPFRGKQPEWVTFAG